MYIKRLCRKDTGRDDQSALFCETHKQKKQLKSAIIIDELPIIHCRGLDNLIATARSNKVAVCLGFQDFSQLKRDYGDKEAAVVMNRRKLNAITTKSKPM